MKRIFVSGQALELFGSVGRFVKGGPLQHPSFGLMPLVGIDPAGRDGCMFEGPDGAPDEILSADASASIMFNPN